MHSKNTRLNAPFLGSSVGSTGSSHDKRLDRATRKTAVVQVGESARSMSRDSPPARALEVLAVRRRRRITVTEKHRIVQETKEPRMTVSLVAHRHGISPSLLF